MRMDSVIVLCETLIIIIKASQARCQNKFHQEISFVLLLSKCVVFVFTIINSNDRRQN